MRLSPAAAILCFALTPAGFAARPPSINDTDSVLRGLNLASFTGTSQDSIQAAATDSSGNIYVAGTTYSSQFPVQNAAQPAFGDSGILRTTDLGATWSRIGMPPCAVALVVADPVSSQTLFASCSTTYNPYNSGTQCVSSLLFASCSTGIYKSTDAGQSWQMVYPQGAASLAIDPGNHLRVVASTPALIRSIDGGQTWTPTGSCVGDGCSVDLIADASGSGKLLMSKFGFFVSISSDWGLTFSAADAAGVHTEHRCFRSLASGMDLCGCSRRCSGRPMAHNRLRR